MTRLALLLLIDLCAARGMDTREALAILNKGDPQT